MSEIEKTRMARTGSPTSARSLLYILSRILHDNFMILPVGGLGPDSDEPGTIEIHYKGRSLGYVNSGALSDGVLGYNFGRYGNNTGAVPAAKSDGIIAQFLGDHNIGAEDIEVQGKGSDTHYLVIKHRRKAIEVLKADKDYIDNLVG